MRMRTLGLGAWRSLTWPSGWGKRPPQRRCGPWPSCRGLQPSLWAQKLLLRGPREPRPPHLPAPPAQAAVLVVCAAYTRPHTQQVTTPQTDRLLEPARVPGPLRGSQAERTV